MKGLNSGLHTGWKTDCPLNQMTCYYSIIYVAELVSTVYVIINKNTGHHNSFQSTCVKYLIFICFVQCVEKW